MELLLGNKDYSSWSFRRVARPTASEYPLYGARSLVRDAGLARRDREALADAQGPGAPRRRPRGRRVARDLRIRRREIPRRWRSSWPDDLRARAVARAVSCEMHAGFSGDAQRPLHGRRAPRAEGRALRRDARRRRARAGDLGRLPDALWRPRERGPRRAVSLRPLLDRRRDVCARCLALPDVGRARRADCCPRVVRDDARRFP